MLLFFCRRRQTLNRILISKIVIVVMSLDARGYGRSTPSYLLRQSGSMPDRGYGYLLLMISWYLLLFREPVMGGGFVTTPDPASSASLRVVPWTEGQLEIALRLETASLARTLAAPLTSPIAFLAHALEFQPACLARMAYIAPTLGPYLWRQQWALCVGNY